MNAPLAASGLAPALRVDDVRVGGLGPDGELRADLMSDRDLRRTLLWGLGVLAGVAGVALFAHVGDEGKRDVLAFTSLDWQLGDFVRRIAPLDGQAGDEIHGSLAFAQSPAHYTEGVAGVLAASVVTAIVGMLWLHLVLPKTAAR